MLVLSCFVLFELLTDWMLERKAFNRLALGPSHPLLSLLVCSVAAAFCPSHGSVRKGGGCVRAHAHVALSVSIIVRFLKHKEWDLLQENFLKASTHGESISRLGLITVIGFVLWSQKKFKSRDIVLPRLCIYLPFFFLNSLPGSSICPKTIVPPFLKRSTTRLDGQNVSDEEAQGINGKTPAKHTAASPKPQGTAVQEFFF